MTKGSWHLLWNKWYFFLLWPLLSAIAFYGLDTSMTAYKPSEKMALFMVGNSFSDAALDQQISLAKPSSILSLEEHFVVKDTTTYSTTYNAFGPGYSDVLFLPESALINALTRLAPLSSNALQTYFPSLATYEKSALTYGVLAHKDGETNPSEITYVAGEDTYLCFSSSSVHLEKGDQAAFVLGKALLAL
jgi:hypothetical protein